MEMATPGCRVCYYKQSRSFGNLCNVAVHGDAGGNTLFEPWLERIAPGQVSESWFDFH